MTPRRIRPAQPLAPHGLPGHLVGFVEALRARGIAVGPSETVDAGRVLATLGLGSREVMREGLACALLRRPDHRDTYDALFDLWWPAALGARTILDELEAADRQAPVEKLVDDLPLFAAASAREAATVPEIQETAITLRPMTAGGEVVEDYGHVGLTLRAHPVSFLRQDLERQGILSCQVATALRDRQPVKLAGLVLVRQRPGSAADLDERSRY